MSTRTGSGASSNPDESGAVAEAAVSAQRGLGGERPDLVIVFASTVYDPTKLARELQKHFSGSPVVGCSTAGEFSDRGSSSGSLTLMSVKSDSIRFETLKANNLKGASERVVGEAFASHQEKATALGREGFRHSTILTLTDGLMTGGEDLVSVVYNKAWVSQVVGGAAADDGKFQRTWTLNGGEVRSESAVFVRMFSRTPIGIGVQHGMRPCTEPALVTEASGTLVKKIDWRPAFDYYRDFARSRGVTLTVADAPAFMMKHELAINLGKTMKIRAPLGVDRDGSLRMAAEIPHGARITIVDSDESSLTQAARAAAQEARDNLQGANAAGVIVFNCICRRTILGPRFGAEIDALKGPFGPQVPLVGFATYGEIARYGGKLNGFHNSTAVVCALPE